MHINMYVRKLRQKKHDFSRCLDNFEPESICWESEFGDNEFMHWIEKNTDLKIINKPAASMDMGTCTTPSEDTKKLERAIDYSKVPHCRDNCRYKDSNNPLDKCYCSYPEIRSKAKLEFKKRYPD